MLREMLIWLVAFTWLSVVASGFWVWERYDATPGRVGERAAATEAAPAGRWQLTLFAHPRCPCTRSSLAAVAELAAAAPDLSIRVLFVRPTGAAEGWERGESWDAAGRIGGAAVGCDELGIEARRCGAETSGHAVLIDPAGRVVFRGGLTLARGRPGASTGRRAVLDWMEGQGGAAVAPVFGCPLFTPDE